MQNSKIQPYFLLALIGGTAVLAYLIWSPFLKTFILALIFAALCGPIYERILRKMPGSPALASFLATSALITFIVAPFILISAELIVEANNLYQSISSGELALKFRPENIPLLGQFFPNLDNFSIDFNQYLRQALQWLSGNLGQIFGSLTKILLEFFIFAVSFYYLLKDGDAFKKFVVMLSPLADTDDETIISKLKSAVNSVIKGNLTIALIQGALAGVGFAIFGVPNFIFWGILAGLCALIPSIGTALVVFPAVVYLFISGDLWQALGLAGWGIVAVGLIDNFLGPKILGKNIKIHPLIILFSVLGGIAEFGPIGFILGPLIISFLFALLEIYSSSSKRSAEQITEASR